MFDSANEQKVLKLYHLVDLEITCKHAKLWLLICGITKRSGTNYSGFIKKQINKWFVHGWKVNKIFLYQYIKVMNFKYKFFFSKILEYNHDY